MANSCIDKYKGADGRLSVYEILQRIGTSAYRESANREYEAVDIHKLKIDGNTFQNYGQYRFLWEKSYEKSPDRSVGGTMGNINSIPTFLTPHLIIDFSIMSIEDYRKFMILHYGSNEHTIECYDTIYNKRITVKMYFATEEMAKLYTISQNRQLPDGKWEEWVDIVGVSEYSCELIGTNNDLDTISVRYVYSTKDASGQPLYPNFPNGNPATDQHEVDVYRGEEIVVGESSTFPETPPNSTLQFKHWVDDNGIVYTNGKVLTVNSDIVLYAVWETKRSYTLSFNYGLSEVATQIDTNTSVLTEILSKPVDINGNIGTLPPLTDPFVEDSNTKEKYYPYENGGWYKHPIKQDNMQVFDNQAYWTDRDTIVYALYDKKPFEVSYVTNVPNTSIPTQTSYYGDKVYLPTLGRTGYKFDGWYIDAATTKGFSGSMPPYSITLYAKWVQG